MRLVVIAKCALELDVMDVNTTPGQLAGGFYTIAHKKRALLCRERKIKLSLGQKGYPKAGRNSNAIGISLVVQAKWWFMQCGSAPGCLKAFCSDDCENVAVDL